MKFLVLSLQSISFLVILGNGVAQQKQLSDGAALCEFYKALTAGKKSLANWCVGSGPYSPCGSPSWTGVTCGPVGEVSRVVSLDVSEKSLMGTLPSTFLNLGSLTWLDLQTNSLSGSLPSQLWTLGNLKALLLAENKFTGTLSSPVGELKALTCLSLQTNSLSGSLPYQLWTLIKLQALFLAENKFTGTLSSAVVELKEALTLLNLGKNILRGSLPSQLWNLVNLKELTLYENKFTRSLPSAVGKLKALTWLNLQTNSLSGSLPSQLWTLIKLQTLALAENKFTGTLSSAVGNLNEALIWLNLKNNSLSGSLPYQLWKLVNLQTLLLAENKFTGTLSSAVGNLNKALTWLNLGKNSLRGSLPSQLWTLINLQTLLFAENKFTGTLSSAVGNLKEALTWLDLYNNSLSGPLPPQLWTLGKLEELDLYENKFTRTLSSAVGDLKALTWLSLYTNSLSGSLPSQLGQLTKLRTCYFTSNIFTSSVPTSFCSFNASIDLDLSENSGLTCLPSCLTNPPYTKLVKDSTLTAVCGSRPSPASSPTPQEPVATPGEPSNLPTAVPTQPTPAPSPKPTALVCAVDSFANKLGDSCLPCPTGMTTGGATGSLSIDDCLCPAGLYRSTPQPYSCLSCPPNTVSNIGATSVNGCVNIVANFGIAFVAVFLSVLMGAVYVYSGRYHRVAFIRRDKVVLTQLYEFKSMASSVFKAQDEIHRKAKVEKAEAAKKSNESGHCCNVFLFYMLSALLVPLVIFASYVLQMASVLVDVLILFRGLRFEVPFQEFMSHALSTLGPLFESLFAPLKDVVALLAFFKIDLSAIQVTCPGATAPANLLIDYVVLGAVVIVVGSDYQLLRSLTFPSLLHKFLDMTLAKGLCTELRHFFLTLYYYLGYFLHLFSITSLFCGCS